MEHARRIEIMSEIIFDEKRKVFHLRNNEISYILCVEELNILAHVYFGERISNYSGGLKYPRFERSFSTNFSEISHRNYSRDTLLHEYPTIGNGDFRIPAIEVEQENGVALLDLRYERYEILDGKPALNGLPSSYLTNDDQAKTLVIYLKDDCAKVEVGLNYTIFRDLAVICRSVIVKNYGQSNIRLNRAMSVCLDMPHTEFEVVDLNGSWGAERQISRHSISPGIKIFSSTRGTSSHQQNPFIALVEKSTTENQGQVYGMALVYSGNHEEFIEQDQYGQLRLGCGIASYGFSWILEPDNVFQTPESVMVYSRKGLNEMSHTFHDFVNQHIVRGKYQSKLRPILINNWEATYFDFDDEKIKEIIDSSAELGIELFVLDDGWFGQRSNDRQALGDWFENKKKLKMGLNGISQYAKSKNMMFGLWFEPEMISENSDLYRNHPEWVLSAPGYGKTFSRNQWVLDLSRQDVREYIKQIMDQTLENVSIDYIKWDMNRYLTEVYSDLLPTYKQGEVYHRYVSGLYELMEYFTKKYPEILFEGCSGGGGRFDLGVLCYMPQIWTSDNTDAIARLKIQYGTSLVYPISTMGAHVSAVPNHQTHRITNLAIRGAVASSGMLGYELNPTELSNEEKEEIRTQIAFYKKYQQLIQEGIFYRLRSPFENNETIWLFVSRDQRKALLFYFQKMAQAAPKLDVVKIPGLNPNAKYLIDNKVIYGGDELARCGFYLFPFLNGDYMAKVFEIQQLDTIL